MTVAAVAGRRKFPYLLVGWLWYLGMMVPVIGLLQIGVGNGADRFTYLPQIGFSIAVVWAAADGLRAGPRFRRISAVATACALTVLVASAWRQTSYWRDSETLWAHTLACNPWNSVAEVNFGVAMVTRGQPDEAILHFEKALQVDSGQVAAHYNLGLALAGHGRLDEAIGHYHRALQLKPDYAEAHYGLGQRWRSADGRARRSNITGQA